MFTLGMLGMASFKYLVYTMVVLCSRVGGAILGDYPTASPISALLSGKKDLVLRALGVRLY